jgi:glycine/D-amino acid oxidase-like deaminating enzyme
LRERCEVRALIIDKNRLRGVVTQESAIEGDLAILASGAWLNLMGGVSADILPRVTPVKGQMIALEPPPGTALPKALLWNDDVYLVSRRDRLFAGATAEDAGFDTSVTGEARDRLVRATARLIPAASRWRLAEIWAGLRPRASDGMPVLGQTAIEGLYVASGQFRNGILLAPLVAEIMCRIVMEGAKRANASFDPKRFSWP